jgi:hypothetical protein
MLQSRKTKVRERVWEKRADKIKEEIEVYQIKEHHQEQPNVGNGR